MLRLPTSRGTIGTPLRRPSVTPGLGLRPLRLCSIRRTILLAQYRRPHDRRLFIHRSQRLESIGILTIRLGMRPQIAFAEKFNQRLSRFDIANPDRRSYAAKRLIDKVHSSRTVDRSENGVERGFQAHRFRSRVDIAKLNKDASFRDRLGFG